MRDLSSKKGHGSFVIDNANGISNNKSHGRTQELNINDLEFGHKINQGIFLILIIFGRRLQSNLERKVQGQ